MTIETADYGIVIPSSPAEIKKLRGAIVAISDTFAIIDGHREQISADLDALEEEYKIPRAMLRKLARAHYEQSVDVEIEKLKDFEAVFDAVMRPKGEEAVV